MDDTPGAGREVAAAFQGGGAKAIAYAGALLALEERGYSIRATAGTSAGSIVATLVAAGLTAQEICNAIPTLLGLVKRNRTDVLLTPNPDPRYLGEYSLEGVRIELERILREKVGRSAEAADVTFSDLFAATKVELNVLATMAPGAPAVFSVYATPDCQVSYAVAASCAIPIVMNPQLLQMDAEIGAHSSASPDAGAKAARAADALLDVALDLMHPLVRVAIDTGDHADVSHITRDSLVVDGGLWANYPGLCFDDPAFRYFYGAPTLDLPSVGFSIDTTADPADRVKTPRFRELKQRVGRAGLSLLTGLVLNPVLFGLISLGLVVWSVFRGFSIWSIPVDEVSLATVGPRALETVGALLLLVLGFAMAAVSRHLRPLGLSWKTIVAGLTSTTLKVPEWVGAHPRSRLILVPASGHLIGTTDFTPTPQTVATLVDRARAHVAAELAAGPLEVAHQGRRMTPGRLARFRTIQDGSYQTDRSLLKSVFGLSGQQGESVLSRAGMK